MELYDNVIRQLYSLLEKEMPRRYGYDPESCWPEADEFELIMTRDAAFELGGSSLPTANCTCVTSDDSLIDKDEVLVYGRELGEIIGDVPYARIAILRVGDGLDNAGDDSEATFRAIQDIDFVKYHVFPKGFMARTSALSNNEQVRIGKQAVRDGISFERIGDTFIRHYRQNPNVLNVRMIFITSADAEYKEIRRCARNVGDITKTLSKIMEGMPTDCHSCSLKPICDEVEGMKELHFGKAKKP